MLNLKYFGRAASRTSRSRTLKTVTSIRASGFSGFPGRAVERSSLYFTLKSWDAVSRWEVGTPAISSEDMPDVIRQASHHCMVLTA